MLQETWESSCLCEPLLPKLLETCAEAGLVGHVVVTTVRICETSIAFSKVAPTMFKGSSFPNVPRHFFCLLFYMMANLTIVR